MHSRMMPRRRAYGHFDWREKVATIQIKDDKTYGKAIELMLELGGLFQTRHPHATRSAGPTKLCGMPVSCRRRMEQERNRNLSRLDADLRAECADFGGSLSSQPTTERRPGCRLRIYVSFSFYRFFQAKGNRSSRRNTFGGSSSSSTGVSGGSLAAACCSGALLRRVSSRRPNMFAITQ